MFWSAPLLDILAVPAVWIVPDEAFTSPPVSVAVVVIVFPVEIVPNPEAIDPDASAPTDVKDELSTLPPSVV